MYMDVRTYIYMYIQCIWMYVHTYTCTYNVYGCKYIHIHMYMYIYMYIHTYNVYGCTYIHIHVHANGILSTFLLYFIYLSPFLSSCISLQNFPSCRYHYLGLLLLFIQDIGDLTLEVTKSILYFKIRNGIKHKVPETLANITFAFFTLQW